MGMVLSYHHTVWSDLLLSTLQLRFLFINCLSLRNLRITELPCRNEDSGATACCLCLAVFQAKYMAYWILDFIGELLSSAEHHSKLMYVTTAFSVFLWGVLEVHYPAGSLSIYIVLSARPPLMLEPILWWLHDQWDTDNRWILQCLKLQLLTSSWS